jgi:uridine kinase
MADLYVLPCKSRATLVVAGTDALDWSLQQVLHELQSRLLLL